MSPRIGKESGQNNRKTSGRLKRINFGSNCPRPRFQIESVGNTILKPLMSSQNIVLLMDLPKIASVSSHLTTGTPHSLIFRLNRVAIFTNSNDRQKGEILSEVNFLTAETI